MTGAFIEDPKHELTIAEAIRRAQDGDANAFEYLYNSHCKRVYGICLRMLKDRSDAEDLTQQVFLRVFQKIGTFRGDSCFSTWLHRVTVNAVLMHLRKKDRRRSILRTEILLSQIQTDPTNSARAMIPCPTP
jgi:RNA polymerase sigma factor (sigma-70 family)